MNGTAMNNVNVDHRPIVEKCSGCDRVASEGDTQTCTAFAFPDSKWRLGNCSMATHIKVEGGKEKVRVGQQKQKKR
ncbi:hypothetical protein C4J81_01610 [Deltaproteobacteria bacterium Smac51]|nr:hypothetical protein C4J81_01610 [Deltaproteobacteria bacterium Smac51]